MLAYSIFRRYHIYFVVVNPIFAIHHKEGIAIRSKISRIAVLMLVRSLVVTFWKRLLPITMGNGPINHVLAMLMLTARIVGISSRIGGLNGSRSMSEDSSQAAVDVRNISVELSNWYYCLRIINARSYRTDLILISHLLV